MATFKYVMTIPSVDIKGFIAIEDLVLIGSEDSRYAQLQSENPVMAKYLAAFRSPAGTQVRPSVVIRDASLPKVDARRLCSFRNAIAVSCVLRFRMEHYTINGTMGVYCTDLFDFYPVSVSSDGTDLIGQTIFERSGWMQVDGFAGSTSSSVIHPQHVRVVPDEWLMIWLLNLLEKKHRRRTDVEFSNRIFRSIELAYHALRSPVANLGAQGDFGVALSLWVSAFEALAYPPMGDVHYSHVSSLISGVPWESRSLRRKTCANVSRERKPQKIRKRISLPVQVYARLYYNRNKCAHGHPLPKERYEFVRRKDWGNLWFQVPALYRCVLCHVLTANAASTRPGCSDALNHAYEDAMVRRVSQGQPSE
jgi:hypothetical protein